MSNARPDAPFRRLNQDCVDIIVEYAADGVDAVLQLRRVNRGMATGLVNLFTLVSRPVSGHVGAVLGQPLPPHHGPVPHRAACPRRRGPHGGGGQVPTLLVA